MKKKSANETIYSKILLVKLILTKKTNKMKKIYISKTELYTYKNTKYKNVKQVFF